MYDALTPYKCHGTITQPESVAFAAKILCPLGVPVEVHL